MNVLQTKLASLTNDVSISSAANLDFLQYVTSTAKWTNRQPVGTETNTSPVAGANDTVLNTTNRLYTYFTLPATAPFFLITGIEWLNGTVLGGSVMAQIEKVNANPPTTGSRTLLAWIASPAQTGISQIQRVSNLTSFLIPASTVCGASLSSNSATARFGTTTVGAFANVSAIAYTTQSQIGVTTSISNGTEEPYIKVYYKPVLGV